MTYKLFVPLAAVLALSACQGFVPAPQGPRVYTAAHDTVDGDCQSVRVQTVSPNGTVEEYLPNNGKIVKCVTDMGQTTKPK